MYAEKKERKHVKMLVIVASKLRDQFLLISYISFSCTNFSQSACSQKGT